MEQINHSLISMFTVAVAVAVAVALSLEHKGTQMGTRIPGAQIQICCVFYDSDLSHIHRLEIFIVSNYVSSLVVTDLSPCPPLSRSTSTATFLVNEETPS